MPLGGQLDFSPSIDHLVHSDKGTNMGLLTYLVEMARNRRFATFHLR